MQFWRVCLLGAVLALTANGQQDGDVAGNDNDLNDLVDDEDNGDDTGNNGDVDTGDNDGGDDDLQGETDEDLDDNLGGDDEDVGAECAFDDLLLTDPEAILFDAEVLTAEAYDDQCFRCIYEGYAFCSDDGINGKCQPAFCAEDDPRACKKCTLKNESCLKTSMQAISQCPLYSTETQADTCPQSIVITDAHVDQARQMAAERDANSAEEPFTFPQVTRETVTIPANQGCRIQI